MDCIEAWWSCDGRQRYPGTSQQRVFADSGGSNWTSPHA